MNKNINYSEEVDIDWANVPDEPNPYEGVTKGRGQQAAFKKRLNLEKQLADTSLEEYVGAGDRVTETEEIDEEGNLDIVKVQEEQRIQDDAEAELMAEPESYDAIIEGAKGKLLQLDSDLDPSNRLSKDVAWAMSIDKNGDMSDRDIKEMAVMNYTERRLAEIGDEGGFWKTGKDFLGLMFIPDTTLQSTRAINQVLETDIVNPLAAVDKFRHIYNELEPEGQAVLFDMLYDKLDAVQTNDLKKVEVLRSILGTDESEDAYEGVVALDAVDSALWVSMAATGIYKAARGINTMTKLSKISKAAKERKATEVIEANRTGKAVESATEEVTPLAKAADAGAKSEEAAAKMGTSRVEAAAAGDPSATSLKHLLLDGTPDEVATEVSKGWSKIDARLDQVDSTLQEGLGLTNKEMNAAAARQKAAAEKMTGVEDVVATPTSDGVKLSYKVVDEETGLISTEKSFANYTVDDVTGGFINKGVHTLKWLTRGVLNSPGYMQGADGKFLSAPFERTIFATSKIKGELEGALTASIKGLTKDEQTNVNNLLLRGTHEEKVYTYQQAVNEGIGGTFLTDKEFVGYANMRKLYDEMWTLSNDTVRKDLVSRGAKQIRLSDEKVLVGRPLQSHGAAKNAYNNSRFASYAYRGDDGAMRVGSRLTEDALKERYAEGYKLVRTTDHDLLKVGEEHLAWALVKNTDVEDLPMNVLNKRDGYATLAYKDAKYFVKSAKNIEIDGKSVPAGTRTHNYFDNITDAEAFKARLADQMIEEGDEAGARSLKVLGDREKQAAGAEEDAINAYGGLYTSARGESRLKRGLESEAAEFKDPIEALQTYMVNMSNRIPLNEYRAGVEARWMNHARDTGALPSTYKGGFADAIGVVENSPVDGLVRTKLQNAHEQIKFMTMSMSPDEQATMGVVRAMSKWTEKMGGQRLSNVMYNMGQTSPVKALRAASFQTMLGMYNWSQLFVQGSGATIALSVAPQHAHKAITKTLAFGVLDNIKDTGALKGAIAKMSKTPGLSDIADDYAAWRRTGMREAVVNTNVDVSSVYSGKPMTKSALGKVMSTGALPYAMGELFNSRVSFSIALEEMKKSGRRLPKTGAYSGDLVKDAVSRAEVFRLKMSRANTHSWQKGVMGVPTQFMSIMSNFTEALFGRDLSMREKFSLIGGQGVLFGTSGIPFSEYLITPMMSASGVDPTDMTKGEMIGYRRGAIGWFLNDYLGVENEFTSRAAIGKGITDLAISSLTQPTKLPEVALGASKTVVDGVTEIFDTLMTPLRAIGSPEELEAEDYYLMLKSTLVSIAKLPASTRNAMLAHTLYGGDALRKKDGTYMMDVDPNTQTIVAQAFGFGLNARSEYWEMNIAGYKHKDKIKGYAQSIAINYRDMLQGSMDNDKLAERASRLAIGNVLRQIEDPNDYQQVVKQLENILRDEHGQEYKLIEESVRRMYSNINSNDTALWTPALALGDKDGSEDEGDNSSK